MTADDFTNLDHAAHVAAVTRKGIYYPRTADPFTDFGLSDPFHVVTFVDHPSGFVARCACGWVVVIGGHTDAHYRNAERLADIHASAQTN